MSIFMRYEGITGEDVVNGSPGFIRLAGFGWGASRSTTTMRAASRGSIEPTVQDVTVSKEMDGSSCRLVSESLVGRFDRQVEIHFYITVEGTGLRPYASYTLKGCGISAYSASSGGDRPMETLSLNFTEIEMIYTAYGDDRSGVPDTVSYLLPSATGG